MARVMVCKQCGGEFLLDYSHGRPRERCFQCVPEGFRAVEKPSGRVKLRRIETINVTTKGN